MKVPTGLVAAGCLLAGVLLAAPQGIHGQEGGYGQAGPGHGPNGAPGKATPIPVDPGRPWGWAVRAFMDDPTQPLYNTTKRKMLDGRQVFSQTITSFDVKAYCEGAAKFDFSRFEMQHSTLRFDEIAGKFWGNANPGFSRSNPLAADSRFHLGVPPAK